MKTTFLCSLFGLLLLTACEQKPSSESAPAETPSNGQPAAAEQAPAASGDEVAVFDTTEGQMVLEFWTDVAPKTVENFKKLARDDYFNGTAFHRIVDGFMIQGGDPLTKDPSQEAKWGTGDPGYKIKGETNNREDRKHVRGVISMAHSGHPDTAGSQFFICLADTAFLDGQYTTFGKLSDGDDVLGKIAKTPVTTNRQGERSKPTRRVEIKSIKIVPASEVK